MQMLKPLTLRHNFSWTFAGNAVYAACQWGMLVVLAKLGSPEMVGQFTLGLAITAPILMLTNLQLRVVQTTDAKQLYHFSDYLGLRLSSTALALFIVAILILMGSYRWETSLVILLIGLAKAIESISDIFYGLIQQHERMDRVATSLMIKGLLSLFLLGIGIYLSKSTVGGVLGLVIAWAFTLFFYDIYSGILLLGTAGTTLNNQELSHRWTRGALCPRWDLQSLRKLVELSFPLGLVMMLISLNANIPRYFIEWRFGERELGIFSAIAYLLMAGNIVVSALGESASPRLAKYYATGDKTAFRTLLIKLVGIGAVLGIVGVLAAVIAGETILTVLYRSEYAQNHSLFVWLMVAGAVSYMASFLGYGMTAARYFYIQLPLFFSVTCTSAIASYWLIPNYGLLGAAIALILSSTVQILISGGIIAYALQKLS